MYDELIKRLRNVEEMLKLAQFNEAKNLITEAADAIVELQGQIDGWIELERKALLKSVPKWIPVTERLPEDGTLVGKLICDSEGAVRIACRCTTVIMGRKTVYTDLVDLVDFLAEDIPIVEWDDCTHITHWMNLPEPPKEDE